jgi:hypothetical protein
MTARETVPPETGVLCVFAKTPLAGATKTRLAPALGEAGAAALARAFLVDTWQKASALAAKRKDVALCLVLAGDPGALPPLDPAPAIVEQGPGDLGARLERALSRELGRASWVVAIGTDSPTLPVESIDRACTLLAAGSDAVIGPCLDGGFYLLGLRRCPAGLLAEVPWSSASTYVATERRLREAGLRLERLETWYDVDEPADLDRLRKDLVQMGGVVAPATARLLEKSQPELSIVVPVLDEGARIGMRLRELAPLVDAGRAEVIVVDGGSSDRTLEIAEGFTGVRVLRARRGRAAQMNAGARAASGRVLLFLHADVALPADALDWVRRALDTPATVAGAFRTWTIADDGSGRRALWLHLADLRSRYSGLPYGDQALFVRRDTFFDVGGFPELLLMEDLELARRLRKRGKIRIVPATVRVSGRRFLAHPLRDTLLINVFPLLYRLGVPASRLAKLYHHVR